MKHKLLSSGLILIITLFFTSCASTKLINPWRDSSFEGPIKKVFVVAAVRTRGPRILIENEFIQQLKARGTGAVGSAEFLVDDAPPTRETLEPRVRESGSDALLVLRFVKKETVETYTPAKGKGVPVTFDTNAWSSFQFPETSEQEVTYDFNLIVMQLTLYEVSTGKPVWSSTSETRYQGDGLEKIKPFARVVMTRLISEGLIK
ncbi:MAG TPA: hypothetical protein VN944_12600 [Nitrospiria bacterium]|nr:hypothetical protein [Nitrospiria bacterium]